MLAATSSLVAASTYMALYALWHARLYTKNHTQRKNAHLLAPALIVTLVMLTHHLAGAYSASAGARPAWPWACRNTADTVRVGILLTLYVFWCLAGPVGRLLTSARMYQNNLKVLIFCRLLGVVEGHIPSAGWHFFLQVLHCVKALQGDGWQGLVQVRP